MRILTGVQHRRLDRLANERPNARVIGWCKLGGPVIRDGDYHRWLKPDGRVAMVNQEIMEDVKLARALFESKHYRTVVG